MALNAMLGGLVVATGAWLAWNPVTVAGAGIIGVVTAGLLFWCGRSICQVWAWSTLLLGLESFAWPVITMVEIRSLGSEPTEEQMGTMLSALLTGLFSAVFWLSFSYGLFKRAQPATAPTSFQSTPITPPGAKTRMTR